VLSVCYVAFQRLLQLVGLCFDRRSSRSLRLSCSATSWLCCADRSGHRRSGRLIDSFSRLQAVFCRASGGRRSWSRQPPFWTGTGAWWRIVGRIHEARVSGSGTDTIRYYHGAGIDEPLARKSSSDVVTYYLADQPTYSLGVTRWLARELLWIGVATLTSWSIPAHNDPIK
jgi:hypothetical protein